MVQLFCPEQIGIPLNFPDILKDYAKSAIRTQPYDLLRWSSEYFRSLANNVSPMVKCRLEKQCKHGQLTKGYIRVLIEQVGRGFFINRNILDNKWRGLCLPQDELLKYLSLCRMIKWSQVHWLKLLAVMVGSINDNITDTIVMLCELLSDDVEGGLARIPIWMFTVIYKYLANLDCSEEQKFMDGKKIMENGELEPETIIDELPYILSTTSIKQAIAQQLRQQQNVEISSTTSTQKLQETTSRETIKTKDFRFYDSEESIFTFLKKFDKFNSFIFYIQENQNLPKLEDFPGPYNISPETLQNARINEEQIIATRERKNLLFADNINKYIYQDQVNMLKELGPPWSWIYKFTTDNCIDKSYNLVEEQSVLSDITPELSSNESFNFLSQKPIEQDDGGSISSSLESVNTIDEAKFVAGILLAKDPPEVTSLFEIEEFLHLAEAKGELDVEKTDSIYTVLCKEELKVLQNASEKITSHKIDMKIILNIVKRAEDNEITFKKIDEFMEYLNNGYNEVQNNFTNIPEVVEESPSTTTITDIVMTEPEPEQTQSEIDRLLENYGAGTLNDPPPVVRKCMKPREGDGDAPPEQQPEKKMRDPPEQAFEKAGLTIDPAALSAKLPNEMILGLIDGPRRPPTPEPPELTSDVDCSGTLSRLGYRSDDSSIFITTDVVENRKSFKTCPLSDSDEPSATHLLCFKCSVPVFPGIGPKIADKTVNTFLRYIKYRAMQQKGLVMPLNFKEDKCPLLLDSDICRN